MTYLFWAFAIVWIALFAYVRALMLRTRVLEEEVRRLAGDVPAAPAAAHSPEEPSARGRREVPSSPGRRSSPGEEDSRSVSRAVRP
jgi:CcmD family protein